MASPDAFSVFRAMQDIQGRKAAINSALDQPPPSAPAPVVTSAPKQTVQPSSYAPSGAPKQASYGAPMNPGLTPSQQIDQQVAIKQFINEIVPLRKLAAPTVQPAKIK